MSDVTESILLSIKKLNSVAPENTAFNDDFILWINGAFSDLHQLGIGPSEGFRIESEDDLWDDFLDEGVIRDRVTNYVALHVRLFYDPPATSFTQQMMKDQVDEMGYRLKVAQEDEEAEEAV